MNARTTTLETVGVQVAGPLILVEPGTARSILTALADRFSQKIMTSAVEEARTVEEISSGEGIPLSTCYRRMQELVDAGLVIVESIVITGAGKRFVTYRSCFKSFRISADPRGIVVEAELNGDVAEKVRDRRLSIGYTGHVGGVA